MKIPELFCFVAAYGKDDWLFSNALNILFLTVVEIPNFS